MKLERFPLGAPTLTLLPGSHKYPFVLEQDFVYQWPGYKNWKAFDICIPKGYQTDLLSIPKVLWPVLSPFGAGAWGALPHDELYSTRFSFPGQSEGDARAMADRILFDAAKDSGASQLRAGIIYSGVRVGGWLPWKQGRAEEASDDLQTMVDATERWQRGNIAKL